MGLSRLGSIVAQQVTIDDLQETLDRLQRRQLSLRSQIALVVANLESGTLDAETQARLEARLKTLRGSSAESKRNLGDERGSADVHDPAHCRHAGCVRAVAPPARLDRTIDEALNVLAWEAVIALAVLIVLARLLSSPSRPGSGAASTGTEKTSGCCRPSEGSDLRSDS